MQAKAYLQRMTEILGRPDRLAREDDTGDSRTLCRRRRHSQSELAIKCRRRPCAS